MNLFIAILAAVVAFLLTMQLRTLRASRKLAGRPAPEGTHHDPRGMIYYFHHPRCGPCRQMGPAIDKVAAPHPGQVVKINAAEDMASARAFGIAATPTTLLVKDGRIADVILGARSARKIEALLQ